MEQIIHSDFIPATGSIGSAATAITANQAVLADSASVAVSASFADRSFSGSFADQALNANQADAAISASHALRADQANLADQAQSASFIAGDAVFGTVESAETASFLFGSIESASYAGFAETAESASHALAADVALGGVDTASYVAGANVDGQVASALSASFAITGSFAIAAESASHAVQADLVKEPVGTANTASYIAGSDVDGPVVAAATAISASHALQADSVAEPVGTAISASHALQADAVNEPVGTAVSASHALRADDADSADVVEFDNVLNKPSLISQSMDATLGAITASDGYFNGDINVQGTGSFSVFKTQYVTSSIIEASGSTKFGDDLDDVHQRTGSLQVQGRGITGSYSGDGSQITGIVSASHALQADAVIEPVGTAISASHALNADAVIEPVGTAISASYAEQTDSASYVAGTGVDGIVESAATASLAQLALIAEEGSGSFTGSFEGSLDLTEAQTIPLGIPVHHARQDQGGVGANFTISLDDSNVQRYAYSASVEFMLTGGSAGGFYVTEFEGDGAVTLTFPSASQNVYYHDGGPAPIGSGSFIGVYGFYYNGSRYLGYTIGEFPL
jgi:hypothetical protein